MQGKLILPFKVRNSIPYFISFFLLLLPLALSSQDTPLSLYEHNPLFYNPSATGNFEGNWRFSANFRNQWTGTSGNYRTATAGFDLKVPVSRNPLGVGVFFMNDESGAARLLYNKIYASVAYGFKLSKNYFRIGVQPGYVFGSLNSWNNWDHTTGTFSAPSLEPDFGENSRFFDLNAGLSWQRNLGRVEVFTGLSFMHLNKPNISFFEGEAREDILSLLTLKANIEVSDRFAIAPGIHLDSKSGVSLTAAGASFIYNVQGHSIVRQVFIAGYLHDGILDDLNRVSVSAGLSTKILDIALNYDLNTGNYVSAAGSAGAFEIAVIYRNVTTLLNSYSIPCERY